MKINEQVPSYEICQALSKNCPDLHTALVWVNWCDEATLRVVARDEYDLNDDMIYLCDAPTETEMKKAILEKKYFQDVWLKSSIGVDGLCYESLEYENDFGIHQIAIGKASTSTEAIAQILEEVMSQP